MLGITQGMYPQHLGPEFIDIYGGEIVSVRIAEKKKPKSERDYVIVEGFKLAANGAVGKTNEEKSWLYDPKYNMQTTISGQLGLSMWAERLVKASPTCQFIQMNTDGVTIRIPRKDYDKCIFETEELMHEINMTYEAVTYKKMVIMDVNNYAAQYENGSCKFKGLFEINKELHKDPSMKIVPIALAEYFFNGVPIKETIHNHKNIYDFCLRLRTDSRFLAQFHYIDEGKLSIKNLSKTTRYYISNSGGSLYKKATDSSKLIGVNVGFITTVLNNVGNMDIESRNINYDFYIKECRKIIDQIKDRQLSLF